MTQAVYRSDVTDYKPYIPYLMPPRACPVCQTSRYQTWAGLSPFCAVECENCRHVFIERVLSPEGLDLYYKDYIAFRLTQEKKLEERRRMYVLDRDFLKQHAAGGRLLDVGCSSGEFMEVLRDDFEVYGIDRDEEAIQAARKRNSEIVSRMVHGTFPGKLPEAMGKLDIVVMRGVIEHLVEPRNSVKWISEILKPGGILFITATPNVDSLCAHVFREKWNQFDPIQHVSYFSERTLTLLAHACSLQLRAQHYPYLETPYAHPDQDRQMVLKAIENMNKGKHSQISRSPAFWGSMMTLVYRKGEAQT